MTDLRELLRAMVAIPSVSGEEAALADFVAAHLAGAGARVERVGDSVVARGGRGNGPRLLLCSHLDTVPVGEGWTRDPFAAVWEDGRLVGRGANDAKASAAAMMAAFVEVAPEVDGELVLALTAAEETSNAGMRAVLDALGRPVDGAVVGEPTGLEVVRAQAGLAVLRATWRGRACHAAHAGRVAHENALLAAAAEVAGLPSVLELDPPHALLGASTVVPTVLRAGERHNVVPDRAELVLDARLAPPHDADEARRRVAERLPTASVAIVSDRLRPVETDADHPLVRAALEAAGREAAIGSTTLSDLALLAGVPAVKCGPGETARSHTPDEHVTADELEAGARFYARFARAACAALRETTQEALR